MGEHLLIAAIDERLIAIGLSDAALEIVRNDQLRDAGEELEGAHMEPIQSWSCCVKVASANV